MEAKKLFNSTVMDLGVFILESVEVQSLEDFISHWKLELWESPFYCEFKLKSGIIITTFGNNRLVVKKL
jgi:hypothetical protein